MLFNFIVVYLLFCLRVFFFLIYIYLVFILLVPFKNLGQEPKSSTAGKLAQSLFCENDTFLTLAFC